MIQLANICQMLSDVFLPIVSLSWHTDYDYILLRLPGQNIGFMTAVTGQQGCLLFLLGTYKCNSAIGVSRNSYLSQSQFFLFFSKFECDFCLHPILSCPWISNIGFVYCKSRGDSNKEFQKYPTLDMFHKKYGNRYIDLSFTEQFVFVYR